MRIEAKQSADKKTLELWIYSNIEPDSYNWFTGEKKVSETSADFVRKQLQENPDVEEIILYINSYGGYVKEALGIYSQLRRHPAKVTGYVDGYAASAASVILMACDKIIMGCNTVQMLHYPCAGVYGNATELRKAAEALDDLGAASEQAYLEHAGDKLSREKLAELMNAEKYLTAKECVELGLCDEISNKIVDMTAAKQQAMPESKQEYNPYQRLADIYDEQFGAPQSNPPPSAEQKSDSFIETLFEGYKKFKNN